MSEDLRALGELLKWVAGVGGALAVIWAWIAKPVRDLKAEIRKFESEIKSQMLDLRENMQSLQGMTDFLTGDRLAQAYAYWMRKGYCPPEDRARLTTMYDMYSQRGLNTLAHAYNQDLLELPKQPPGAAQQKEGEP